MRMATKKAPRSTTEVPKKEEDEENKIRYKSYAIIAVFCYSCNTL